MLTEKHRQLLVEMADPYGHHDLIRHDSDAVKAALAEIERLEAELDRLRRGPAVLIQEHTGKWHVFEDAKDAYAFEARTKIGPGYIRASVQEWHYYPKMEPEPC